MLDVSTSKRPIRTAAMTPHEGPSPPQPEPTRYTTPPVPQPPFAADTPSLPDDRPPGGDTVYPAPQGTEPAPLRIGAYEVLEELGRGGMGVVYRARHRTLGHQVALKMILAGTHAGREERARFVLEAVAVARLHHP